MLEDQELWEKALIEIENNIPGASFSTWFKDTFIVKQEGGAVHLGVPNQFTKEWLFNKYHKFILKHLRQFSESVRSVEYVVCREEQKQKIQEKKPTFPINELPLSEYYVDSESNLNPKYTFENFVVGPFNELAFAASQAIIEKPGMVYNPLFIYGNTGHGKTHLIQAMGNYVKMRYPGKKVYYITSEKFSLDFVNSMLENRRHVFKEKYRKFDVFIMDDIQFLSKQERTQEELFHLFDSLYENNKQIIFSSDKHVNYIPNLEARLKSRFSAGMIIDIPEPDIESRIAIIKSKCERQGVPLQKEVVDYIAESINGNIRELEGSINNIFFQMQIKKRELSLLEVKNIIKETTKPKKMFSVKEVIKTVSEFYNIAETVIYEKTRKKEVVKPRQIIMYILREDFKISYPTIGEKLGGRDHTTVIHSCEKIKKDLVLDTALTQELRDIRMLLGSSL